jgi:hypothetical protein
MKAKIFRNRYVVGCFLLILGIVLGTQIPRTAQSTASNNLIQTETDRLHGAILNAVKTMAKQDNPNEMERSNVRKEIRNHEVIRQIFSRLDTLDSTPSVQKQKDNSRRLIANHISERFGNSFGDQRVQLVLDHFDVLQKTTENPLSNAFATPQEKMEALKTSNDEAIENNSSK